MVARDAAGREAVVLLSGGLDSMVSAALAREAGYAINALTIDYNQRHRREIDAAREIAALLGARRHVVLPLDLRAFGGSALTDDIEVPKDGVGPDIPVTYVPARNLVFLSLTLAWAEAIGARDIFIGVNALDYSGYPDCRPEFIDALERLANLATKTGVEQGGFRVHAPLIQLSKAEIIRLGLKLGVDYSQTVSCYQADQEGCACGRCDSCRLRRAGFEAAGVADPTRYSGSMPI